ncbi:PTS lactose/cellobiose transporter subunit IIA, partial [Bacillus thuringiensis]
MDTIETKAFHLILHGGNARSCSMEAIDCAKRGEFTEAEAKLQEALEEL